MATTGGIFALYIENVEHIDSEDSKPADIKSVEHKKNGGNTEHRTATKAVDPFVKSSLPRTMKELPSRPRCSCICGCKRRPGTPRPCSHCGKSVGPGCCWNEAKQMCHMCYYEPVDNNDNEREGAGGNTVPIPNSHPKHAVQYCPTSSPVSTTSPQSIRKKQRLQAAEPEIELSEQQDLNFCESELYDTSCDPVYETELILTDYISHLGWDHNFLLDSDNEVVLIAGDACEL